MTFGSLRKSIRRLYGGATPRGIRFRYAQLAFDIATVLFIIATSFLPSSEIIEALDVLFGIVILADFVSTAARQPTSVARVYPHFNLDRPDRDRFVSGPPCRRSRRLSPHPAQPCGCSASIRC